MAYGVVRTTPYVSMSKVPISKAGTMRRVGRDTITAKLMTQIEIRNAMGTVANMPKGINSMRMVSAATMA